MDQVDWALLYCSAVVAVHANAETIFFAPFGLGFEGFIPKDFPVSFFIDEGVFFIGHLPNINFLFEAAAAQVVLSNLSGLGCGKSRRSVGEQGTAR